MESKPGIRELVYFLSRRPLAKHLGEWRYDPSLDAWIHPSGARMKVACEAAQSIAYCQFSGGLTGQQIEAFITSQMDE